MANGEEGEGTTVTLETIQRMVEAHLDKILLERLAMVVSQLQGTTTSIKDGVGQASPKEKPAIKLMQPRSVDKTSQGIVQPISYALEDLFLKENGVEKRKRSPTPPEFQEGLHKVEQGVYGTVQGTKAPRSPPKRTPRQGKKREFTNLGSSLSEILPQLLEAGVITLKGPFPVPNPFPKWYRADQHCDFHQGPGHSTDACIALKHTVQDLLEANKICIPGVTLFNLSNVDPSPHHQGKGQQQAGHIRTTTGNGSLKFTPKREEERRPRTFIMGEPSQQPSNPVHVILKTLKEDFEEIGPIRTKKVTRKLEYEENAKEEEPMSMIMEEIPSEREPLKDHLVQRQMFESTCIGARIEDEVKKETEPWSTSQEERDSAGSEKEQVVYVSSSPKIGQQRSHHYKREFSSLGCSLSEILASLSKVGVLSKREPRPPPNPLPKWYKAYLHCEYHQTPGHATDECHTLRHEVQNLLEASKIHIPRAS